MLYRLMKIMMTGALRLYYRRVYATGPEIIPVTGPLILVANHPSSLMDAAFLGILLKRPIHYFTRGDIFINRFVVAILNALHMIPVHDHQGKHTVTHNDDSFEKAKNILEKGGIIVIFPEGSSHVDRTLKPLKKGAFRLALQTYASSPTMHNLLIVPIGINYADPVHADTDVLIHFNTPISVSDYWPQYQSKPAAAILQMKNDTETSLLQNVLHIREEKRRKLADTCLAIQRNEDKFFTTHWMLATTKRFDNEKAICNGINQLDESQAIELDGLLTAYTNELKKERITDEQLAAGAQKKTKQALVIIGTFPLFVFAYLLNALPVLIARRIVHSKVRRADFYAWILLTTASVLCCCWLVVLFAGFAIIDLRYAAVITLLAAILGPYTIYYLNKLKGYRLQKRYQRLASDNPASTEALHLMRGSLLEKIKRLVA